MMSLGVRRATATLARALTRSNQTSASQKPVPDVKGLSNNVVQVPNNPVGPGAAKSTDYKNPEYFCYNDTSYFEAEVEMSKFRCPQPSNKKK